MKKFKFITLSFFLLFILASCTSLKEGLTGSKKNSKDEFLVQKKNPLVQPPNFNNLPEPERNKNSKIKSEDDTDIKKLFEDNDVNITQNTEDKDFKSIEDSILEKINEN
jgi:hypothetical protein